MKEENETAVRRLGLNIPDRPGLTRVKRSNRVTQSKRGMTTTAHYADTTARAAWVRTGGTGRTAGTV